MKKDVNYISGFEKLKVRFQFWRNFYTSFLSPRISAKKDKNKG